MLAKAGFNKKIDVVLTSIDKLSGIVKDIKQEMVVQNLTNSRLKIEISETHKQNNIQKNILEHHERRISHLSVGI